MTRDERETTRREYAKVFGYQAFLIAVRPCGMNTEKMREELDRYQSERPTKKERQRL